MNVVTFMYIIHFLFICRSTALSVEERLLELENVVKIQGTIIAKHEKVIEDQNFIIKTYEKERTELTLRVERLESDMEKLEETSMSDDAIIHQQLHMNMQNRSDALGEDEIDGNTGETKKPTDAVEDRHISMSTRSRMMKRQNTDVAFHAYISGTPCFQNHEVYVFNVEELDLGNGYNTRDGIYVVPFSGHYVFTWTVGAYNDHWYRTDIVIDGATSTWITTQDETAATGIVVKHVSAGDHVFIRRHSGSYCGVHDEFNLSSFSGWKIF